MEKSNDVLELSADLEFGKNENSLRNRGEE